jgi:hypothetical protein
MYEEEVDRNRRAHEAFK